MLKEHNPGTVHAPLSRYSHGIEAPADKRWLYISGQVGVQPDGTLAPGPEGQMVQAWRNLFAVLAAAGMGSQDLVKVTVFLTGRDHIQLYRAIRNRMLAPARPASTLLIVAGLADPEFVVEIEAIAAA